MDLWYISGSFRTTKEEPIIKYMVNEFSEDEHHKEFILQENVFPTSSSQQVQSFSQACQNIQFDLSERMCSNTKEVNLNTIKEYHNNQDYKFVVVESKRIDI